MCHVSVVDVSDWLLQHSYNVVNKHHLLNLPFSKVTFSIFQKFFACLDKFNSMMIERVPHGCFHISSYINPSVNILGPLSTFGLDI